MDITKYATIDIYRTGQNILRLMKLHGYTAKDLQRYLNLSCPQAVYHWMAGRNLPTIDHLYALSDLFDVPVDAILQGNRKTIYTFTKDFFWQRGLTYYELFGHILARSFDVSLPSYGH